ncbi:MAG TPA: pitrilysin family protein [Candidatus Obscuribacterales bacterium]
MIRKTTLDNGARILTEYVPGMYSASIGIWVDVGSKDENTVNNGVSHALEHMLFKGTKSRTARDIAQEIEDAGGSLGAATGKENTCFYGRVIGDQLPVAIDLLIDMLLNATLAEDDLDLERQVILEEIKMYEDDPEDVTHETLIEKIWPGHPLSRPITGTHDTVSMMTSAMLHEHVQTFYTPENFCISIAGQFDEEAIIAQLTKGLSKLKTGKPKPEIPAPKIEPFTLVKYKDVEQAHIVVATDGVSITDPRRYAMAILDMCLGGNMSSRLFQEVREKRGLVYTINTYRESHAHSGLFGVYAGCSPKNVDKVLQLTMEEFAQLKDGGFTHQEINRAKTQLKSELLLGLESMRYRTSRNAYSELYYGRQLEVDEITKDIDKVTSDEITEIARQFLKPDLLSMVIVGPQKALKKAYALAC